MTIIKAKKVKMTQIWDDVTVIPVTVLQCDALPEGTELPLTKGEKVTVTGTSKGRGFQGVVKRHGFHGGPASHGQKDRLRAPGSSGATAPQRVIKGKKMAGHMGVDRVTVKNLKVALIDLEKNIVMVEGAVPGNRGGQIFITKQGV
jgi:large subunit ribosomal protein L3